MTVLTEKSSISYVGDGVAVSFTYDFKIFNSTECLVKVDDVVETAYTITGLKSDNGGQVIFDVAPELGADIKIMRDVPYTQNVDYEPYDPFPAETHEAALDRIVMMIQQVLGINVVQGPEGIELVFPAPGAGEFVKYTDDGTGLETADIKKVDTDVISVATDAEIVAGVQTQTRLVSPYQINLGVQSHETAPIASVYDVAWVSVVDTLPATPNPNTMYLVRN